MRIKSYFADSVQEAIEKARIELGPEAMLMNSKKTDFELRALGSVEVVFGLPGESLGTTAKTQKATNNQIQDFQTAPLGAAGQPALSDDVAQELAHLRRQIETVKRSVSRQQRTGTQAPEGSSRAVENLCARLMAADLSEELALQIAEAAELEAFAWKQSGANGMRDFEIMPSENLELALAAELDRRFQVAPELGRPGARQKVVMFVGPAGAGKTTALIKLGLRCGLQARLPMQIFSLDTLRVGGWEHLAAYARIAGLGFEAIHNLNALEQMLSEHAAKKLILIDTPGFGPAESDDLKVLAEWVQKSALLDVQLVMPAGLRATMFDRLVDRFSILNPAKLLLTRADEVESTGIVLDLAMRSKLPLSYISNGQTIPEDIQQACKASMLASFSHRKQSLYRQEAA